MIDKPPMLERLWAWNPAAPPYFAGANRPTAVVLHIAAGWRSTAEAWASAGHYGASWHYFVCLDGTILHQLDHQHGAYQAGIGQVRDGGGLNPAPTWPLWRGWNGPNVNNYTIGVEHEGFGPFTPEQAAASRWLCQWLAQELGFPYDRDHFPAHADIALIDRANDFGIRFDREAHYRFMFQEDDELKASERFLLLRASGDFATMETTYAALDARGFFKALNDAEGPVAALDGDNDLNDSLVRRFRLQWLALSDAADKAMEVLS